MVVIIIILYIFISLMTDGFPGRSEVLSSQLSWAVHLGERREVLETPPLPYASLGSHGTVTPPLPAVAHRGAPFCPLSPHAAYPEEGRCLRPSPGLLQAPGRGKAAPAHMQMSVQQMRWEKKK